MPPHNVCSRCVSSPLPIVSTHPRVVTTFFLIQLAAMLVLHVWHLGGITQPEAFCAGTTAAYRKGNGSNSALTPPITLRPPISPAPVDYPCTRFGAQASNRATAPTSAAARTGPTCRRMPRRLAYLT
eukprot:scaffold70581_cov64-Phaeocystis_antarctica.AAC.1